MSRTTFDATLRQMESGTLTCERMTAQYRETIEAGKRLNAFLSVFPERSLERAREVDRRIAGARAGCLAGMVVAIKDVICIKGERVTYGSRILEKFEAPYDATVITRLEAADACRLCARRRRAERARIVHALLCPRRGDPRRPIPRGNDGG